MRHTLTAPLAVALALAAQAAPAAAVSTDRQTHPRHTGESTTDVTQPSQDLRSPDARAVAMPSAPNQDLRSPDTRDAAAGPTAAPVPAVTVEITATDGFDWGDAVIGAGGAIGLLSISLAGAMSLRRRRPRSHATTS